MLCGEMAGTTSVVSILSECQFSMSQEEVLANLRGGWERNGHFSLDETPSQNLSPSGVQPNLLNSNTEPPLSYEGDSGSSSSESVDGEAGMGFTQEPVEWISPSSTTVGAEGNDGSVAKEDSYVAAFESDRSQSPSQDWHGQIQQQVQTPHLGMSAEFLTQPALGVMDFQFASSEDLEHQILRREAISGAEFQGSSLLLLPPIPENTVSVIEGDPVFAGESCIQPFTQPALETQPPEPLIQVQEPANQMQLAEEGRTEMVHDPIFLDKERAGTEEPQPMQQESGPDELLVKDAATGEPTPQGREENELSSDSQLPIEEHRSHEMPRNTSHVEVHRGGSGLSDKAQPLTQTSQVGRTPSSSAHIEQTQRSNGDATSLPNALNRVNCAEELLQGPQKRLKVEAPSVRARSFPETVMDVVRSRSRSLSNSLAEDECNILSIIMRAGVSFPPFVYEKRSV